MATPTRVTLTERLTTPYRLPLAISNVSSANPRQLRELVQAGDTSVLMRWLPVMDLDRKNDMLTYAAEANNLPLVQAAIAAGAYNILSAANAAARYGLTDTMRHLLTGDPQWKKRAEKVWMLGFRLDGVLQEAAAHGHLDLALYAMQLDGGRRVNDWGGALETAAAHGQIEIATLMLQQLLRSPIHRSRYGDLNRILNSALRAAARFNHPAIIELLEQSGQTLDWNAALIGAAAGGHQALMEQAYLHGARSLNEALAEAAGEGQIETTQQLLHWGANDLDSALNNASGEGHFDLVLLLLNRGAPASPEALEAAASIGSVDLIYLLAEHETFPRSLLTEALNTAMIGAIEHTQLQAIDALIRLGADLNSALVEALRIDASESIIDFLLRQPLDLRNVLLGLIAIRNETEEVGDYLLDSIDRVIELSGEQVDADGLLLVAMANRDRVLFDYLLNGPLVFSEATLNTVLRDIVREPVWIEETDPPIRLLLQRGATAVNDALNNLADRRYSSPEPAELLIEFGASNLDEALARAQRSDNRELAHLLLQRGAQSGVELPPQPTLHGYEPPRRTVIVPAIPLSTYRLDSERPTVVASLPPLPGDVAHPPSPRAPVRATLRSPRAYLSSLPGLSGPSTDLEQFEDEELDF